MCALPIWGCGDDPSTEQQVESALRELRDAFDSGDVAGVCEHVVATGCPTTIRMLEQAEPSTSDVRSGARDVIAASARQDRARAIVTLNERVPGRLRFVERDGEWKLTSVAAEPVPERSSWPLAGARVAPVVMTRRHDERRTPCPPLGPIDRNGRDPTPGGCAFRVASRDVPVLLLTAFGDFTVARCAARFDLSLAPNLLGLLADRVEFAGPAPCGEMKRCADKETGLRYPWQGDKLGTRTRPPFDAQLDICVNTPLGRARGMQFLRVVEDGDAWAFVPHDYPIGASSLQLGGRWRVTPAGFDLPLAPGSQ